MKLEKLVNTQSVIQSRKEKDMARIVFMGTPEFAKPILAALADNYEIAAVYTRADRPSGRGKQVSDSPIKAVAVERGLTVEQPGSLRGEPVQARLKEYQPDVIIVAAYGLILPQAVLDIPRQGCINTHASLLPCWRGASPITAAILAGDTETGVTLMQMDSGVDTGPIIAARETVIAPDETTGTLSEKLSHVASDLLLESLPAWLERRIAPIPQFGSPSFTGLVKKEDGLIDWGRPAVEIERAVRAYNPWPSAYTFWRPHSPASAETREGMLLKIWAAEVADDNVGKPPGTVVGLRGRIGVTTGSGVLILREVQLAGKRLMSIEQFVTGQRGFVGSLLGAGGSRQATTQ